MSNTRTGQTVANLKRRQDNAEERIDELEAQPSDQADLDAEIGARQQGDKANADAIAAEAKTRVAEDTKIAGRQVKLSGTLTLPAGLGLVGGKTIRTAAVTGLKAGDDIAVTFSRWRSSPSGS